MIWISAIVTVLMIAILFVKPAPTYYPLSEEQAIQDIKKGQVRLITFGLAGADKDIDRISSKYGFKECNMGCVVEYTPEEKAYKELVDAYLDKRNGEGWRERYYRELDSLKIKQENQQP
jgi:hypothetical protein